MVTKVPWIIAGVALILLTGVTGGLVRFGWNVPSWGAVHHGFLMASAGFGTLITLERAVALASEKGPRRRISPLGFPLISLLSGVLVLAGYQSAAAVAALLPALWLLQMSTGLFLKYRRDEFLLMALGALSWCVATFQWWRPGWEREWIGWMSFLLLTVTGERLDLSRFLKPSILKTVLLKGIVGVLLITTAGAMFGFLIADALLGASVLMLALWLLFFDAARFTLKRGGQASTSARALLGGFVWLAVAGCLMMVHGIPGSGWIRDAIMHSFFLGFILMMVFAHGPIIVPALTPFRIRHHRYLDLPPILLSLGLALRVAGDLGNLEPLRRWGGMVAALALASFALGALFLSERRP